MNKTVVAILIVLFVILFFTLFGIYFYCWVKDEHILSRREIENEEEFYGGGEYGGEEYGDNDYGDNYSEM